MLKVTILGAASAKPTATTHPSAQVVNCNEQYYLIDAGEGVQQQMFRCGINPLKLRAIFISHLHGDHCFGLFPLLSTLGLYGKKTPLQIYAPAPLGEILEYHFKYFDTDLPYKVEWVKVDTTAHKVIFENRTLEVISIPLRHRVPTSGYLFAEKLPQLNVKKEVISQYGLTISQIVAAKRGEDIRLESGEILPNEALTYYPFTPKSYAYCSDTTVSKMVARRVKGVSLLYHEATYDTSQHRTAKSRGHSTTADAAKVATEAEAKRLLIGHFSSRYKDYTELLNQAKAIFENCEIAEEGKTYIV